MEVRYDKLAMKVFLWPIAALAIIVSTWVIVECVGAMLSFNAEAKAGQAEVLQEVVLEEEALDLDMPVYNINLDKKWQKLIYDLSKKNGLDYKMVISFFELESEGFKLDLICYNKDSNGNIISYDSGIAQINSRQAEVYRQHAVNYCELDSNADFDPLNPDHGIRAGIGGLTFYRDYWRKQGITGEEELFRYSLNSYNMGAQSYKKYIKNTGQASRSYNRAISKRMEVLDKNSEF